MRCRFTWLVDIEKNGPKVDGIQPAICHFQGLIVGLAAKGLNYFIYSEAGIPKSLSILSPQTG
jgi:hypothetical protein